MPRKNYDYLDVECQCCHNESLLAHQLEYDGDGNHWVQIDFICPVCNNRTDEPCEKDVTETRKMIKKIIEEDILRGVPDFVISEAAEEACSYLKSNLLRGINQRSLSGAEKRSMIKLMNKKLKELETEIHECIKDKIDELKYEL